MDIPNPFVSTLPLPERPFTATDLQGRGNTVLETASQRGVVRITRHSARYLLILEDHLPALSAELAKTRPHRTHKKELQHRANGLEF